MQKGFITGQRERLSPYVTKVHYLLSMLLLSAHCHTTWNRTSIGGTTGMKLTDSQQSKHRISTTPRLAVPSWATVTAKDDEAASFNQVSLHIPASKWWLRAWCSFINRLHNFAVWIFGIAFNGYWTLFYWRIVNLQGCFSFKYIAKWFHFVDMYVYFLRFFSIRDYYKILSIVLCVTQ